MDRAWLGAEAYHLWLLGQRQLLAGNYLAAMRTALNLRKYTDIIDARSVYLFLLLASLCEGYLGVAAKATMKLEAMAELSAADRENVGAIASAIFVHHPPQVPCIYLVVPSKPAIEQVWPSHAHLLLKLLFAESRNHLLTELMGS
jgi:WD repeat-containing protein 35